MARELDEVVRSAVAAAGVNLNTASASLSARVPGFNARVAADVAARRDALGAFRRRAELLDVRGIGPKTFQQAAGFLRVDGAEDALERTGVHPEAPQSRAPRSPPRSSSRRRNRRTRWSS